MAALAILRPDLAGAEHDAGIRDAALAETLGTDGVWRRLYLAENDAVDGHNTGDGWYDR